MPERSSSRDSDDLSDIDGWMRKRAAEVALRPEADAAGRDLWAASTQNGDNLYAGRSSDLPAIGLAALNRTGSYPTAANDDGPYPANVVGRHPEQRLGASDAQSPDSGPPSPSSEPSVSELEVIGRPPGPTTLPDFLDRLNHSEGARIAGGVAGYVAGLPWGVLRSGLHAVEGVVDSAKFANSLLSPEGRAKALDDAKAMTHGALQYGRSVAANPSRLIGDAVEVAKAADRTFDPLGTPMPDTASGTFLHEAKIGGNLSETALNIAGLIAAPEVLGGVVAEAGFAATREANVAKFLKQGFDEPTARDLSKRYQGQGEHALIPRRQDAILGYKTPWLKKATIPDWIMDSPLNVSKPRGMSQGDFYEYHYGVDRRFHGARLPSGLNGGKGWSGKRLGAERYQGPGRIWARTPQIWKDSAAGVTSADALDQVPIDTSEGPQ